MRADLSRRQMLAGLLAAPVVVPAVAMGMVEAAPDYFAMGRAAALDETRWYAAPAIEPWTFEISSPRDFGHLSNTLQVREGDTITRMICRGDIVEQQWLERFIDGQWVKVEDETPATGGTTRLAPPAVVQPLVEIDEAAGENVELTFDLGQTEGLSPDLLDEDAATYCAVA